MIKWFGFLLISINVFAEDKDGNKFYQVLASDVKPGYSALVVSKGFSIGKTYTVIPTSDKELSEHPELREVLRYLTQFEVKKDEKIEENVQISHKEFHADFENHPIKTSNSSLFENSLEAPLPEFHLEDYIHCTYRALPLLKQWMKAEIDKNEQIKLLVSQEIDKERGDGKKSASVLGAVCGKFLGKAGFQRLEPKEEIKLTSVFSLVSLSPKFDEEEKKQLLRTLICLYHPNSPVLGSSLWSYLWKKLSLEVVFLDVKLSKLESIFDKFKKNKNEYSKKMNSLGSNVNVDFVINGVQINLDEVFQQGLEFSKKLIP